MKNGKVLVEPGVLTGMITIGVAFPCCEQLSESLVSKMIS